MKKPVLQRRSLQNYSKILIFFNLFLIALLIFISIPKAQKESVNSSLISEYDIEKIFEITISISNGNTQSSFNTVRLIKKDDGFVLHTSGREYMVKQEIIKRFFSVLASKEFFLFVTNDVKQFGFLGLEQGQASEIKIMGADKTVMGEFMFGKQNTIGSGRYVRMNGSVMVFQMPDIFSPFLTLRPDFWIDFQIYKTVFTSEVIQALEKNNEYIIRSEKNEKAFSDLESFLRSFSVVDIFAAFPVTTSETETFTVVMSNKERIQLYFTPLEGGDFIIADNFFENAYVISGYTRRRIDEAFDAIRGIK